MSVRLAWTTQKHCFKDNENNKTFYIKSLSCISYVPHCSCVLGLLVQLWVWRWLVGVALCPEAEGLVPVPCLSQKPWGPCPRSMGQEWGPIHFMPRPGKRSTSTDCEWVLVAKGLLWLSKFQNSQMSTVVKNLICFLVIIEKMVTLKCFDFKKKVW